MEDGKKTREELLEEIALLRVNLSRYEGGGGPSADCGKNNSTDEDALKAERKRLYSILDVFPGFVYLQAPDHSIAFANRRFIEAYGEPNGRTCYEVMWGRKEPCDPCPTFRVFETKEPEVWVSEHTSRDLVYQVYDEPFFNTDGTMLVLEISIDITDRKRAEEETAAKLHYVRSMNEINETFEEGLDLDKMLTTVLEKMLSIFDCNRAWLLYPVDLDADSFTIPYQVTTPDYPVEGVVEIPVKGDELALNVYKEALASRDPLTFIFDLAELPEGEVFTKMVKDYEIRSQMIIAFHPKVGKPWMLGLHQCSYAREWTTEEQRLFKDISVRITDAVTGALFYKDLKENEERLRTLVENIPGVSYRCALDEHWTMEFISSEVEKVTGYPASDFIRNKKRSYASIIHPEDMLMVDESVRNGVNLKKPYTIEYRIRQADGKICWVFEKGQAIFSVNGDPLWLDGVVVDITERKRIEVEANRNYHIQRVISSILHASLRPISLSEILDYSLNAILSVPFSSILNKGAIFLVEASGDTLRLEVEHGLPESLKTMCATVAFGRCACGLAASSRKTVFIDHVGVEHTNRYDGIIPHGHFCVPIVFDDVVLGVINSYVPEGHKRVPEEEQFLEMTANTLAGIIVRKRAEEEREALQAQLLHSQKMEAIGRLTSGIAHDFNNLMTAVKTLSSLGGKKAEEGGLLQSYFTEINNASKRATALTRQLSLFSKKGPVVCETVNINSIIETNLSGIISSLIGSSITLTYELSPDLWTIEADTSNIEQIIMNLIINAKDAMPGGGSLTVRTENNNIKETSCTVCTGPLSGRYVSFEVTDTGVGMEKDTVQKIFEPFFTTKPTGKGTGLGLSVIYGIVNSLNGSIDVASAPGDGSAFRIYLPACAEEEECSDGPHPLHASDVLADYGGGELILFVEDDEMVHEVTGRLLMENGYRVEGAATLAEASELFKKFRGEVGLLLSDVTLPDGNGIEFAKELAKVEPGLSVILYSGQVDYGSHLTSFKELGFEFIEKPFEIPAFLEAVKKALA